MSEFKVTTAETSIESPYPENFLEALAARSLESNPEGSAGWLKIAHLRMEKCELKQAQEAFLLAYFFAKKENDPRGLGEALVGILRFSGEALDESAVNYWSAELEKFMRENPDRMPSKVWYCRGAAASYRKEWKQSQREFHRYLRAVRQDQMLPEDEYHQSVARAYIMLANAFQQRGLVRRAQWLAERLLENYEKMRLRGINGTVYLVLGNLAERRQDYKTAMDWYQKAHAVFLEEHNWYHHLYVLYGYARVARQQQDYRQANFYLDLIEKAASMPEFGVLRRELALERKRLQKSAVDLLVDGRRGVIKTRENQEISLRKQYVLLDILKALLDAHNRQQDDPTRGLSKAQIIQKVWHERYRPEAHDNKLYYNINRLRKLIEPDARQPQYLLNWKEGYRLAPGLRVQWVDHEGEAAELVEGVENK
ncbi:MAG: winged helix-turn-helix domain-containing protein [Bacteriovoracia bacterium]